MAAERLDPWGAVEIKDYDRLLRTFGIRPFSEVLPLLRKAGMEPSFLMRRGIIFGHRDFDKILEAKARGERVAVLTGFMPSGKFHFGHKLTVDQLIYLQKNGFKVFVAIADAEAFAVRRIGREEAVRIAVEEYIANMIALGLDPKDTEFYFQTNRGTPYFRLIQLFSGKVTAAEMEAIYGELTPAKMMASLTQAADILHVQLDEYGGYRHVVVPVGADQDPHLRLTRDLADRMAGVVELERPASTYHKLQPGLDGRKMSSSRPDSTIFLTDPPEVARNKLFRALTGGRATAEEQRRLGGVPEVCSVYHMDLYHLMPDDGEVKHIYTSCRLGKILCGECKQIAWEKLERFLAEHQSRLEKAKTIAWKLVEPPRF
ncbi:tryptophanyl-tRNA synthetase [Aeropyrum pernix K1]|uniref:Tryptophan--tRNA ligase n=1 Tax=Aeropyrum pernix (strain ATCC 700893 / DSM 11879 / JCM 9820 / NBRC 100138 / K1) TaxID=272557 RepID=SYW_AERPE|nr:tryptophan--tRNA ligase [Aeropyrum pernix]Q9Y924.2 RecName: Full=Tryptophan--tRNA ligase; AltName: Full=Tryptophanyl-tRNA synthetase; Short=TrpRS [Aeropyrum pernix K1]3A04_A Chain A, Tryptophanyl-tRNA synthetase [Aeropyrum pernix]3A05_A Chain A, Tryptophanyl-tRNA synthetase [Aeropyrum pernix]BAA81476.2 tryptophanyl-tRNA synthetase [Aeropyrum pernix K1]